MTSWGAEMATSGDEEFDVIAKNIVGKNEKQAVLIYFTDDGEMRIATKNHGPFETAEYLKIAAEAMANLKMVGAT